MVEYWEKLSMLKLDGLNKHDGRRKYMDLLPR
jgi:hypothetical protein